MNTTISEDFALINSNFGRGYVLLGICILALVLIAAVSAYILLRVRSHKLKKQLELEYGPDPTNSKRTVSKHG